MGIFSLALVYVGCVSTVTAFQPSLFRGAPLRGSQGTSSRHATSQAAACGGLECEGGVWTATMSSLSRHELLKKAGVGLSVLLTGATSMAAPGYAAMGAAVDVMRLRFGDKLRRASKMLDELQQDIFNDEWDLISTYPNAFRALVPVFTKYTDAAFPGDDPVDTTSRVALRCGLCEFLRDEDEDELVCAYDCYKLSLLMRTLITSAYEVGRFFGAVERLKRAAEDQNQQEAQKAFASMSVAYDRYLKAGNLYENYDAVTSTEGFYSNIDDKSLKFVPPNKDPPKIRDNVLMLAGPDKGKTGYVIGLDNNTGSKAIIKLETSAALGIREIKVVPLDYVAKTVEQKGIPVIPSKKAKPL